LSSHASLSLEIEYSTRSQRAVVAMVAAIVLMVPWWLTQLSFLTIAVLVGMAATIAAASFWRMGWLGGKRALRAAVWAADGDWRIVDRSQASWTATLLPASRVLGSMIWLRFMSERGPRALLLVGSDLAPDVSRQLIVRLRLQASQATSRNRQLPQGTSGAKGFQP